MEKVKPGFSLLSGIWISLAICFVCSFLLMDMLRVKNTLAASLSLPEPTAFLDFSYEYDMPVLKGIVLNPDNPYELNFIVDTQNEKELSQKQGAKLLEYFLAALTIPKEDLWVNLSPYEENRVIPYGLGLTELGKDMLSQDYILKQMLASSMHPEKPLGKDFWHKVHSMDLSYYDTIKTDINTANKIWIVPDRAIIQESGLNAMIYDSSFSVMLEEDYLASVALKQGKSKTKTIDQAVSSILRETIVDEIENEVNYGKNFYPLRQMYSSILLASWFKDKLRKTLFGSYLDSNNVNGLTLEDEMIKDKLFELYVQSFRKGVYNLYKKEKDPNSNKIIKRHYISGGLGLYKGSSSLAKVSPAKLIQSIKDLSVGSLVRLTVNLNRIDSHSWIAKRVIFPAVVALTLLTPVMAGETIPDSVLSDIGIEKISYQVPSAFEPSHIKVKVINEQFRKFDKDGKEYELVNNPRPLKIPDLHNLGTLEPDAQVADVDAVYRTKDGKRVFQSNSKGFITFDFNENNVEFNSDERKGDLLHLTLGLGTKAFVSEHTLDDGREIMSLEIQGDNFIIRNGHQKIYLVDGVFKAENNSKVAGCVPMKIKYNTKENSANNILFVSNLGEIDYGSITDMKLLDDNSSHWSTGSEPLDVFVEKMIINSKDFSRAKSLPAIKLDGGSYVLNKLKPIARKELNKLLNSDGMEQLLENYRKSDFFPAGCNAVSNAVAKYFKANGFEAMQVLTEINTVKYQNNTLRKDLHAYNVINVEGVYYILDLTARQFINAEGRKADEVFKLLKPWSDVKHIYSPERLNKDSKFGKETDSSLTREALKELKIDKIISPSAANTDKKNKKLGGIALGDFELSSDDSILPLLNWGKYNIDKFNFDGFTYSSLEIDKVRRIDELFAAL